MEEYFALLRESLALNPDQEIAHFNLGWLLVVRAPAEAERHFLAAARLVPDKGGAPAYALLHQVLTETKKAGVAKVVIRTRQHLAAVKAQDNALVLELMHFAHELVDVAELNISPAKGGAKRRELDMAEALIEQMTEKWEPARYTDDYTSALMSLIKQKIASGGKVAGPVPKPRRATNVIDLAAVLKESLERAGSGGKKKPAKSRRRSKPRKAA